MQHQTEKGFKNYSRDETGVNKVGKAEFSVSIMYFHSCTVVQRREGIKRKWKNRKDGGGF